MYRKSGVILLVVGLGIAGLLVMRGYSRAIPQWIIDEEGNPNRVTVDCPAALPALFGDALQQVAGNSSRHLCFVSARIKFIEALVLVAITGSIGIWGITRGWKPQTRSMDEELPPLPKRDPGD